MIYLILLRLCFYSSPYEVGGVPEADDRGMQCSNGGQICIFTTLSDLQAGNDPLSEIIKDG